MRKKELQKIALSLTDGLLRTATDATLLILYTSICSIGKTKTSVGAYRAYEEAQQLLGDFNYETIKNIIIQLKQKRYITYKRKKLKETLEITKEGKKRLQEILPTYYKKRSWDGRMYLVTYDIPEKKKKNRELLREYIKRLAGGMLQKSVWITPYNPREVLEEFIQQHHLSGIVLVSDMGKDGAIGDYELPSLIQKVYHLDALNDRYQKFIKDYSKKKKIPLTISIAYFSILKDDPQLPFQLLPAKWLGDRAYELYANVTNELPIYLAGDRKSGI